MFSSFIHQDTNLLRKSCNESKTILRIRTEKLSKSFQNTIEFSNTSKN